MRGEGPWGSKLSLCPAPTLGQSSPWSHEAFSGRLGSASSLVGSRVPKTHGAAMGSGSGTIECTVLMALAGKQCFSPPHH